MEMPIIKRGGVVSPHSITQEEIDNLYNTLSMNGKIPLRIVEIDRPTKKEHV